MYAHDWDGIAEILSKHFQQLQQNEQLSQALVDEADGMPWELATKLQKLSRELVLATHRRLPVYDAKPQQVLHM